MADDHLPCIGAPATRALTAIGLTTLADVAGRSELVLQLDRREGCPGGTDEFAARAPSAPMNTHEPTEAPMSLQPYLFFSGTCREAMTAYQQILGGELDMMSFADLPEGEAGPEGVPAEMIMHAGLVLPDGALLMASDDPTGDGTGVTGCSLHLGLADEAEVKRVFDALAEGGTIEMPLESTFWSPLFGSCVDRFGTSWMISLDAEV